MWSRDGLAESHTKFIDEFLAIEGRGHFAGRKIVLVDPDAPRRARNIYEDLDQRRGAPSGERDALVTLYPEYAISAAQGLPTNEPMDGLATLSHAQAIKDARRMIDRFGYRIALIDRDIFV